MISYICYNVEMKLALLQMDIIWENRDGNLSKAAGLIKQASADNCDVAVLPEMFSTGFSMNTKTICEDIDGKTVCELKKMALSNNINIIAGVPIQVENHYENRAFVIDRNGLIVSQYTKNYSFSYSGEDQKYQKDNKQVQFNIEDTPSSVFICYDLRFPELFRKVSSNVSTIFLIASWPESRIEHWNALLKARAIENQCFIVAVNRIGIDGNGIKYNGNSVIIDPSGGLICKGDNVSEYITTEIDINTVDQIRNKFPFLKDMKE